MYSTYLNCSIFLNYMIGISWKKIFAYILSNVCTNSLKILIIKIEFSTNYLRNVWLLLIKEFNYSYKITKIAIN